jgi:hypothetical protein
MTDVSRRNLLKWTVAAGAVVAAPMLAGQTASASTAARRAVGGRASAAGGALPQPFLLWCSDAVKPGEVFSVNGEYLDDASVTLAVAAAAAAPRTTPPAHAVVVDTIQRDSDGHFASAFLPATLAPGIYEVWANTTGGWSNSVLLNGPRPLFTSEREAWSGQSITLVGRNFLPSEYGATGKLQARLSGASGVVAALSVSQLAPYSVTVTLPSGLAAGGPYQVEVSHGGKAWIAAPDTDLLTVVTAGADPLGLGAAWAGDFAWSSKFPVSRYGAVPNSGVDETANIQAAVNAAKAAGGGVVTLPAGQFQLSGILLPADVVVRGAGAGETTLISTAAGGNFINSSGDGTTVGHHGVAHLSIQLADDAVRPDTFIWLAEQWGQNNNVADKTVRTASEVFIVGVDINYGLTAPVVTSGQRGIGAEFIATERVIVANCKMTGYFAHPAINYITNYYTVRDCTFDYSTGDVVANASRVFYHDNVIIGNRTYSTASGDYDLHGLFARDRCLMANNNVSGTGTLGNYNELGGNANDGEALCVEGPDAVFSYGAVVSATPTSLTVDPVLVAVEPELMYFGFLTLVIVDGTGLGQIRTIDTVDAASSTFTITEPWDIIPDTTSVFAYIIPLEQVTFWNNTIQDCTQGLWLYGNQYDSVAADNTSIDSRGSFIYSVRANGYFSPSYFVRIARNTVQGVSPKSDLATLSYNTGRFDLNGAYYGTMIYGVEFRDNTMIGDPSAPPITDIPSEEIPWDGIAAVAATISSEYDGNPAGGDGKNITITGNQLSAMPNGVTVTHSNFGVIVTANDYTPSIGTFLTDTGAVNIASGGNTLVPSLP